MDEAARRLGGDAAAFRAAYWQHRHAYDADLPAAAYWQRVAAATRPGALTPGDLAWLIASDVASWSVYHDEVWALAARAAVALFVDDRADNVEAAASVGLQTLQFEGPDALERLRALVR